MKRRKRHTVGLIRLHLIEFLKFLLICVNMVEPCVVIVIPLRALLQLIEHIVKLIRAYASIICIFRAEFVVPDFLSDIIDRRKGIHPRKLLHIVFQRLDPLCHPRLLLLSIIPLPHVERHRLLVERLSADVTFRTVHDL